MSDKTKLLGWFLVGALLVLVASLVGGCSAQPGLRVQSRYGQEYADQFQVNGHKDAGKPATAESSGAKATVPLPAGSRVSFTPADQVDAGTVSVELSAPSSFTFESRGTKASTGTIDTETAKHRIDKEQESKDRAPLMWAGIGAVAVGIGFMVMRWTGVATICFVAAGVFGAAWKMAEVPWWAGLAVLACGAALFLGYKRGEWDADGDGTPDFLQKGGK